MLNKSTDYTPDYTPVKKSGQVMLKHAQQSISNVHLDSYNDGTFDLKGSNNGKLPPLIKARNSNSVLQLSRRSSNNGGRFTGGGLHNKSYTHSQPALHPLKSA